MVGRRPDEETAAGAQEFGEKLHQLICEWVNARLPADPLDIVGRTSMLTDAQIAVTFAMLSETGRLLAAMGFDAERARVIAMPVLEGGLRDMAKRIAEKAAAASSEAGHG